MVAAAAFPVAKLGILFIKQVKRYVCLYEILKFFKYIYKTTIFD